MNLDNIPQHLIRQILDNDQFNRIAHGQSKPELIARITDCPRFIVDAVIDQQRRQRMYYKMGWGLYLRYGNKLKKLTLRCVTERA